MKIVVYIILVFSAIGVIVSSDLCAQENQQQIVKSKENKDSINKQQHNNLLASLKSEIVNDLRTLDRYEQAVSYGWLGRLWWTYNINEAYSYFLRAVEIVEDVPTFSKEDVSTKKQRLDAVRKLVELVSSQDQVLEERLKDLLSSTEDGDNESLLVNEIETAIEKSDKVRAINLWNEAFAKGYKSYEFIALLLSFRRFKDNTADQLFVKILKVAPQIREPGFHWGLALVVYPESENPMLKNVPVPPDNLRIAYLEVLSAFLFDNNSESNRCKYAPVAASLLSLYAKLEPTKAGAIRIFSNSCKNSANGTVEQGSNSSFQEATATTDELLVKAKESSDKSQRAKYILRAASKAKQEGDLEKAINILDLLENKTEKNDVWDILRRGYASELALRKLANNDITSFYKIISECPEHLIYFVKIMSIKWLIKYNNKSFATNLFQTLPKDISNSAKEERVPTYLMALDLSMTLSPSDSLQLFRDLIGELDKPEENKKEMRNNKAIIGNNYTQPLLIPSSFIKLNAIYATAIASEIKTVTSRLSVRIGILKAIIDNQAVMK